MTTSDARAKAQAMLDAVKAGKILFTRQGDQWLIIGQTSAITSGHYVTVTKANGHRVTVKVTATVGAYERQGLRYSVATYSDARDMDAAQPTTQNTGFRWVHGAMGAGKRYYAQPGCTYYDDGSGRYSIQIWDES